MRIWIIEEKFGDSWEPAHEPWFHCEEDAWDFLEGEEESRDGYRVVMYERAADR